MDVRRNPAALLCSVCVLLGLAAPTLAQDPAKKASAKVPLVSVVGCASRAADGKWELLRATAGAPTQKVFSSTAEIEAARKTALGRNTYQLLGTAEFVTKEELLKTQQRAEFTRPVVANATGMLRDGAKVVVKGLLIDAPEQKRVNLMSVQRVADACK